MDRDRINNGIGTNFDECIKCTICTVYCPVTAVNHDFPGPKQAGPDGERYRLKKPYFYDEALKYCLNCKRCEVACPSEVRIGDIIQQARLKYSKHSPSLRDRMLASTDFVGTMATPFAPIVNRMLHLKLVKKIMDTVLGIDSRRTFPSYSRELFTEWYKREAENEQLKYDRHVAYFHGCYVQYNYPQLGKDMVKIMNALGYGVILLEEEKCCGVAKIANGLVKEAARDADINLRAIRRAVKHGVSAILSTSSTCTFTIRDEYTHVLGIDARDVRDDVMLATRFVYSLIDEAGMRLAFRDDYHKRVAYHVPCHMERLGWSVYSMSLMRMIPGLDYVPLDPNCCGIAGTYGFKKENYDYSQAMGRPLFDEIERAGVDLVATDCETCKWQIEMSTGLPVQNPISILADAIDVEETKKLNNL